MWSNATPAGMAGARGRWARGLAIALLAVAVGACATRTVVPPAPTTAAFPDFVFPEVPSALRQGPDAGAVDAAWRALQANDLEQAARRFAEVASRRPDFHPARAGAAYVALARQDHERAVAEFDAALGIVPAYAPALSGKGQALLALGRDGEALTAFEAAHAADPSLDLAGRIDVLRFRRVQGLIEAARAAGAARDIARARAAYGQALAASPESGFLHRELGVLEADAGDAPSALGHFREAVAIDATDAVSWTRIGDILAARQDFAAARGAYESASAADPSSDLADRIEAVLEQARLAAMPQEFRAIAGSAQMTRGDLAALLVDRLGPVVALGPARQAVVTDTRGHWAAPAIAAVVRAGVIDPFPNHTFQPRTRLRRADLASAASRILVIMAARDTALAARLTGRPAIADVGATHLDYPAVARVVAAGVMPLENGRFLPGRAVPGAEAAEVLARLRQLAPAIVEGRP